MQSLTPLVENSPKPWKSTLTWTLNISFFLLFCLFILNVLSASMLCANQFELFFLRAFCVSAVSFSSCARPRSAFACATVAVEGGVRWEGFRVSNKRSWLVFFSWRCPSRADCVMAVCVKENCVMLSKRFNDISFVCPTSSKHFSPESSVFVFRPVGTWCRSNTISVSWWIVKVRPTVCFMIDGKQSSCFSPSKRLY